MKEESNMTTTSSASVVIDTHQLRSLIREAVAEAMRNNYGDKATMSKREAQRLFVAHGKTPSHLDKLIDDGIIRTERASHCTRSRISIPKEDVFRVLNINPN